MEWTREGLKQAGFAGFVTFGELDESEPPRGPGVYIVLRENDDEPVFLFQSPAGRFKDKDPSVILDLLEQAWVPRAQVVYIGKANAGKKAWASQTPPRVPPPRSRRSRGALGRPIHLAAGQQ